MGAFGSSRGVVAARVFLLIRTVWKASVPSPAPGFRRAGGPPTSPAACGGALQNNTTDSPAEPGFVHGQSQLESELSEPRTGISSGRGPSDIPSRLRRGEDQPASPSPGFRRAGGPPTSPPACGGAMQTVIKIARSSKLVALFLFRFAVRGGFEPPVR